MNKTCVWCGTEFSLRSKIQIRCSKACTRAHNNHKHQLKKNAESIKGIEHEVPKCLICGYKSRALPAHLRYAHSITIEEYKDQFSVNDDALYHSSYVKEQSQRIVGKKNPAYNHNGKYSPYSKKFIKYNTLSKNEIVNNIQNVVDKMKITKETNESYTTRVEYYLNKGMSDEEAINALSKRQTTFSLDICINKYGLEEGLKRWQDRQHLWHSNFKKSNYSKISQELFWSILNHFIKNDICIDDVHFATKFDNGLNNEISIRLDSGKIIKPDFIFNTKIIEFYGDYWHSDKRGTIESDMLREQLIRSSGYQLFIVRENDYRNDKNKITKDCLNFLFSTNENIT